MNQPPISSPPGASPLASRMPEPAPPTQSVRIALPSLAPTVTYALIGFTVMVYLLQLASVAIWGYAVYQIDWLEIYGARFNTAIRTGELWRFITPVFLHGSPAHIFFNMYALLSIGTFMERQLGHVRFALLYFLGAFSGIVFSFLLTGENGYLVGALTAVSGLIGVEVIFFYRTVNYWQSARKAIGNTVFIMRLIYSLACRPALIIGDILAVCSAGDLYRSQARWMVTRRLLK